MKRDDVRETGPRRLNGSTLVSVRELSCPSEALTSESYPGKLALKHAYVTIDNGGNMKLAGVISTAVLS